MFSSYSSKAIQAFTGKYVVRAAVSNTSVIISGFKKTKYKYAIFAHAGRLYKIKEFKVRFTSSNDNCHETFSFSFEEADFTRLLSWLVIVKMTSSNEKISALLALCAGNSPVTGEFPSQRPVTRNFDVFFDLRPVKRLSKQ